MSIQRYLMAAAALVVTQIPAMAHHSFAAEFDVNQPVTINGAVKKMDWVNPHTWIYVDVKNADGTVTTWRFEMGPPNALLRMGWRKDSVPPGTQVDITGFKAKDGEAVANAKTIKLPDGRELFSAGSGPGSGESSGAAEKK
jgi:DNA/RNA endonuclease YhcR with UshA esterase domain